MRGEFIAVWTETPREIWDDMSNFTFLKTEWPDLHDAASKAESLAYPDARMVSAELDALFATRQHRAFRGELKSAG